MMLRKVYYILAAAHQIITQLLNLFAIVVLIVLINARLTKPLNYEII
jgi:hypothetical protein